MLIMDLDVGQDFTAYVYAKVLHLQVCCGDGHRVHQYTFGVSWHKLISL